MIPILTMQTQIHNMPEQNCTLIYHGPLEYTLNILYDSYNINYMYMQALLTIQFKVSMPTMFISLYVFRESFYIYEVTCQCILYYTAAVVH